LVVIAAIWLVCCFTVVAIRVLARHILAGKSWWGVPAVIVGSGKTAELVIDRIRLNPSLNLKIIQCLDGDSTRVGLSVAGVPVVGTLSAARAVKKAGNVNYAIVAMPDLESGSLASLVQHLGTTFSNVVVISHTLGMTSVGVGTRDSGGV